MGVDAAGGAAGDVRLTAWLRGRVQGVGMRWWVRSRALELGLRGTATNRADGRVEVVAEGPPEACRRLLDLLEQQPSTAGRPGSASGAAAHWSAARGLAPGFREC